MKKSITNIQALQDYTGWDRITSDKNENGEDVVVFKRSNSSSLQEFIEEEKNVGSYYKYEGKYLFKIRMFNGGIDIIYENDNGQFSHFSK